MNISNIAKLFLIPVGAAIVAMLILRQLDPYNGIAVAIAYLFCLLVWAIYARSQRVDSDAVAGLLDAQTIALLGDTGDDEDSVLGTILKGILMTVATLVLAAGLVWFSREFTPVYAMYHDINYASDRANVDKIAVGKDIPSYLAATRAIERTIQGGLSIEKEREIALLGANYLESASDLAPKESDEKRQLLQMLLDWSLRYGLSDKATVAKQALKLNEPTPTPLPTATPTRTMTPTPVPTMTPTPVPQPGENNPCDVPSSAPRDRIALHPKVDQGRTDQLAPNTNGVFGRSTSELTISENVIAICLSSTPDGRGEPQVDDQLEFMVSRAGQKIGEMVMPFYDKQKGGIRRWPSQNVKWLFPASGTYRLDLILRDTLPQVHSSTDIWIVVW